MIVGICGAAGAGKDTAAKGLLRHKGFVKASFAAPLKALLNQLFGWEMSDWDSLEWKETVNPSTYGKTPRQVAQTLGTDWGRDRVDTNIWVDAALRSLNPEVNYVFTDVRFPNEAAAIRAAGGILIYVSCLDRETGTDSNQHESESWLEWLYLYADVDIAANFGQIEKLQEATINVVDNYERAAIPRYEPGTEVLQKLNAIEQQVLNNVRGG